MGIVSRTLVWMLLLLTIRWPLPWGHSHDGLNPQELVEHLGVFHTVNDNANLPQGWHWHFLTPGGLSAVGNLPGPPKAPTDEVTSKSFPAFDGDHIASGDAFVNRPESRYLMSVSQAQANRQRHSFLLLKMLLI